MNSKTFIGIYRGGTVGEAHLIAVTADRKILAYVAQRLLDQGVEDEPDPVIGALEAGRLSALAAIVKEADSVGEILKFLKEDENT